MAPMHLTDPQRQQLLLTARSSIEKGCETGGPLRVKLSEYDDALQREGASFVTLKKQGELRGCIGTLEAYQPLVQDVSRHAYAAAFSDPRFNGVVVDELADISISVSVLTPSEKIPFSDETELLEKIQPGIDGLILEEGGHRGTFLPAVWESLPDKHDFLRQLKRKAGLPEHYWSDRLAVSRYQTFEFSEG